MIPRADLTGTRPVGPIEPAQPALPAGDPRQEAFHRLTQSSLGKQFQAQVMSRLVDGSFAVKIADATVRMNLPTGARVGDALDLTLVATHPRPAFLLGKQADSAGATLSNGARLIDSILRAAQKDGSAPALVGKTPVVPAPGLPASQLASALKDVLDVSGLFYESHLGQWVRGERPTSELMREPQTKFAGPPLPARTPPGPDADAPARSTTTTGDTRNSSGIAPDNTRAAVSSIRNPLPAGDPAALATKPADSASMAATAGTTTTGPASPATETLSAEAVRMISLQLDALEQRHVAWQGELWPGQPMEWEVTDEAPERQPEDAAKSWQSVVRFELPSLGLVCATIRLAGNRVQVHVDTADEGAATLLREQGKKLGLALAAAGSPLDMLTVGRRSSDKER